MNTLTTRTRFTLLLAVGAFALAGCASGTAGAEPEPTTYGADAITISDAWVKSAESGMSAGFGELVNDSDADITVVSAETAASSMLELHETVENEAGEMIMREIEGGFVIPAHGSLALEPGGDHIMLMDLAAPLVAGDEVTFTLTFADDTAYEFTAPVKDYAGANENYEGGDEMDMDH
jgi:periplasmic copper chaperone A